MKTENDSEIYHKEDVEFRRIHENELQALSSLAKQTFFDTFDGTCTQSDMDDFLKATYQEEILSREWEQATTEIWVARHNQTMIAYMQLNLNNTIDELKGEYGLEIQRLYVQKEYFRKKVGKSFMELALKRAAEIKSRLIWLGVWEHNYRAQRFYESFGFSYCGSHPFPIGSTPQQDLWMRKDLA